MNINNLTQAHRCLVIGTQRHTLSVLAAKERQLQRAQTRDQRHRRRQLRFNRCLDAALTAGITIGVLAVIGLLAMWLQ